MSHWHVLEWYPWEMFSEVKKIGEGGFGTVFRAKREVGKIWKWDHESNQWLRYNVKNEEYVALKTLADDFLNEVLYIYY